ncbi:MAG TPA: ABC transporter ATP-binding protein [Microbacterium sp.]|nr:ABC transporter ATP-binding protein [Microbacterium sp.]
MKLQLTGISKSFGSFHALTEVDFDVRPGEVHALVGENGAGKSTLMRILAGQLAADTGSLLIGEHANPTDHVLHGRRPGVGFVEQEGGLILELNAAENLVLIEGHGLIARTRRAGSRLGAVGERLGQQLNTRAPVGTLAIGDRQRIEIAVMLATGADILVLDEPTAALGIDDAVQLAATIRAFTADGGSVIYISHKLREVIDLADRVTILRRGQVVAHHDTLDGVTVEDLAAEMIGHVEHTPASGEDAELVGMLTADESITVPASPDTACFLQDVAVSGRPGSGPTPRREPLAHTSFALHKGEIVGVAGVVGSGQETLAEVLAGLTAPDSGTVARASGHVAYMPEARRRDAIAAHLSVTDNLVLHRHRTLGSGPFLPRKAAVQYATRLVEEHQVRTPSLDTPIGALSGGNQQRAVLARELDQDPVLVVAHNPFRGLDVRAIHDVETALIGAAERGAGVVLLSPDLDELHRICSRIVVLFAGTIVGEVDPRTATNEQLGRLMGGAA